MDQREFNRDMDSYLKDRTSESSPRRKGGFWEELKGGFPKITLVKEDEPEPEPAPENVPKDQVEAVLRGEKVEPEEPYSDVSDVGEEIEDAMKGPSIWQRIGAWFSPSEEEFDEYVPKKAAAEDIPKPAIDQDVKEMLRICVHWVNMLPPETIQDIKRSDDFTKFKDLLNKYGLLKKK